jgi:nucleoside-diphosphate-sugar epimerase
MLDLARKCCDLAGAPRTLIQEVDPPAMQTVVKRLDTSRLRALGWEPTVELDEGMREVLAWVRNFDIEGRRLAVA